MAGFWDGEEGRDISLLEGIWAFCSGSIIRDLPDYELFRRIKGRGSNASGGDYCSITRFLFGKSLSILVTCTVCFAARILRDAALSCSSILGMYIGTDITSIWVFLGTNPVLFPDLKKPYQMKTQCGGPRAVIRRVRPA